MPDRQAGGRGLLLVATGSVAAVKTVMLLKELRAQGWQPEAVVTPTAFTFITPDSRYDTTQEDVDDLKNSTLPLAVLGERLPDMRAVLVVPASAEFLRNLAYQRDELSCQLMQSGKIVCVAPAMNVMMWRHPAVQANVRRLVRMGVRFLGPIDGGMACGDEGVGRLAEPADIVAGVSAILSDTPHELESTVKQYCRIQTQIPFCLKGEPRRILLVAQSSEGVAHLYPTISALKTQGYVLQCVLSEEATAAADVKKLESLTGNPVVYRHYQIYHEGMEHIWLAEKADAVVMLDGVAKYIAEMSEGGASSFIGCLYLATKRPVILFSKEAGAVRLQEQGVHVLPHDFSPAAVIDALAALPRATEFAEQTVLVLGGRPRERVDSFRFYANHAEPENKAALEAARLVQWGAKVTFIAPHHTRLLPFGALAHTTLNDGTKIESYADMLRCAQELGQEKFSQVLNLAAAARIRCATPVDHKIQKNGNEKDVLFDVVGNVG